MNKFNFIYTLIFSIICGDLIAENIEEPIKRDVFTKSLSQKFQNSCIGPTGATGAKGATGASGIKGATGATGQINGIAWLITGNTGTDSNTNFLGTIDNQDLEIRANNIPRLSVTTNSQIEVLNSGQSVFLGEGAGAADNLADNQNVFVGYQSGNVNVDGTQNTAVGVSALLSNTSGATNTAVGSNALNANTVGFGNCAFGSAALLSNSTGIENTAIGRSALRNNTTANLNTAIGYSALLANNANSNTAVGASSLSANASGTFNTAVGNSSLIKSTGSNNTALGNLAGSNLTAGSNNIYIGNSGLNNDNNTIRIGQVGTQTSAFISGIRGVTTGLPAVQVLIDSNGQLGTISSSGRYKFDIKSMNDESSKLMNLRPVTFRYKKSTTTQPIEYGLIAEEVEKVCPDMVVYNNDGQVETVQYHKLTPMMLNELQKQHKIISRQSKEIADLNNRISKLEKLLSN